MKIYTSYYYQIRNFPTNLIGLSTAIWPPKYIKLGEKDKHGVLVIDCPPLQPGKECNGLCNGKCPTKHPQDCEFLQTYYKQLSNINFSNFMASLEKLTSKIKEEEQLEDIDFAFLVYEAPQNSCS